MRIVRIRTFSGPAALMHAGLGKTLLASEGIDCLLQGELAAAIIPVLDIPLLVREEDAERASSVLETYWMESGIISRD